MEATAVVQTSRKELETLLEVAATGCQFCSVTYSTTPGNIKSPKTTGMGERIRKTVTVNPLIGSSMEYKNSINRRLEKQGREPIDQPKPRKWGARIPNSPFVEHTTKAGEYHKYLEANFLGTPQTRWFLDGVEVPYSEVAPYLREKQTADTYDLGEDAPRWRDIRLDHVDEIQVNHTRYVVS